MGHCPLLMLNSTYVLFKYTQTNLLLSRQLNSPVAIRLLAVLSTNKPGFSKKPGFYKGFALGIFSVFNVKEANQLKNNW